MSAFFYYLLYNFLGGILAETADFSGSILVSGSILDRIL